MSGNPIYKQDMPPKGGFSVTNFARDIPKRGPSSIVLLLGTALMMGFGMYKVITFNRYRKALFEAKRKARLQILPYLQAEQDRIWCLANKEKERTENVYLNDEDGTHYRGEFIKTRWVGPALPTNSMKLNYSHR
eukprot:TRINITY_DN101018_c0_g1_i1.p1 TRINITY_DN101018_c0_g1~~TRINITY_DN101018_c0_g1_i1.p1  ORF type:complete len:134 (+),score=25.78 TRINITY_DN101018_c0_g1_i1:50-451(+)